MRWKWSRCRPRASARIALITSPWLTTHTTRFGMRADEALNPVGGPVRHLCHRLALRELSRRRQPLDGLPRRFSRQLAEGRATPVAVVAFREGFVHCGLCSPPDHQVGGLPRAQLRAGHQRVERHVAQPAAQVQGLISTSVVQRTITAACEDALDIGHRTAMPDEQNRGHVAHNRRRRAHCERDPWHGRVSRGPTGRWGPGGTGVR